LRGDEDDDDARIDTRVRPGEDNDADSDNDRAESGKSYFDEDDGAVADFGHAPTLGQARLFRSIVERYEVAASVADGEAFCKTLQTRVARAAPAEFGTAPGPAYLRGDRTCARVVSDLLKHMHRRPSRPPIVTRIRVGAEKALVLIGSPMIAASYITLEREHGRWRIAGLMPSGLP
jgi:hypothetical protein